MRKNLYFNSRWLFCLFLMSIIILSISNISAKEHAGLILHRLDSLQIPRDKGFDFLFESVCTSFVDNSCPRHFEFLFYGPTYELTVPVGYSIKKGKMNLDSIKIAPPDSIFQQNQIGLIDYITVDSLSSRIGNCYILKTGTDPRAQVPFRAKIKILDLRVIDSASHQIKMKFLWACNGSGMTDLTTSGLDTFHLATIIINQQGSNLIIKTSHYSASQSVFIVSGNNFSLPPELVGKVKWLSVWDLQGKRLAEIILNKSNLLIQMPKYLRKNGILIIRAEINN